MIGKLHKIKKFTFSPRFHVPTTEVEEEEKNNKKITFRRIISRRSVSSKKGSSVRIIIVVIVLMFLIKYLFSINSKKNIEQEFDGIKIEVIE